MINPFDSETGRVLPIMIGVPSCRDVIASRESRKGVTLTRSVYKRQSFAVPGG